MIRSFFGLFSIQNNVLENNAATIIQRHYKTYIHNNNEEKLKLKKVINDTINNSYDVVTIDKYGNTHIYKEYLEKTCDDESFLDEYEYYLMERKRIKEKSLKFKDIVNN